jgi:hypothetical protein
VSVYTLSDTAGNVFYVGCTIVNPEQRFREHMWEAKGYRNRSRKSNHIRDLKYNVIMEVVHRELVTGEHWTSLLPKAIEVERVWINHFQKMGFDLKNGREKKSKQHA